MFKSIREHQTEMRQNILNSFVETNSDLEKAITLDEFNKQYGQGHEVYSVEGLQKFEKDLNNSSIEKGLDGNSAQEELNNAVKGLQAVLVKNEKDQVATLFVRKKPTA